MSLMSEEALSELRKSGFELKDIEEKVEEIAFQLDCMAITPGQAKTELAQLETQAKILECKGVDAVYTSELTTGKEQAKTQKKDQLRRLELLFERLEALFAKIRAMDPGGK